MTKVGTVQSEQTLVVTKMGSRLINLDISKLSEAFETSIPRRIHD